MLASLQLGPAWELLFARGASVSVLARNTFCHPGRLGTVHAVYAEKILAVYAVYRKGVAYTSAEGAVAPCSIEALASAVLYFRYHVSEGVLVHSQSFEAEEAKSIEKSRTTILLLLYE